MSATLKACPFCGGPAGIAVRRDMLPTGERDELWQVQCYEKRRPCGCKQAWGYPLDAVVDAWNRRAR